MDVTGSELQQWREKNDLSLDEMGKMLGGKSGPTISRWENGQPIPGDTQLLLKLLIRGEMPFPGVGPQRDLERERKYLWELMLSLNDWHVLETLAIAAGFQDTKDYILSILQEHLRSANGGNDPTDDEASGKPPDDAGNRDKKKYPPDLPHELAKEFAAKRGRNAPAPTQAPEKGSAPAT